MDGCMSNFIKYVLFFTNFCVFVLGLVTLGFGIWVVVDKPGFLGLFEEAEKVLSDNNVTTGTFDIGVYAGAPYILIIVAVIVTIIAFFGCFGALKESKCMLITYFVIVLAIFIACIVGAVLVFQGTFEEQIKVPLMDAVKKYKDKPTNEPYTSYKNIWNEVQGELKCCGVNGATDWKGVTDWDLDTANKPIGCCKFTKVNGEAQPISPDDDVSIEACRRDILPDKYYFEGCYTKIVAEIESQQDKIFGAAIGTVVVMFLNMVFSFALCTMAD